MVEPEWAEHFRMSTLTARKEEGHLGMVGIEGFESGPSLVGKEHRPVSQITSGSHLPSLA